MKPIAGLALTAALACPAAGQNVIHIHHARGTFQVTVTPQAQASAPAGGLPTGRLSITKTFAGALAGTARGTMLTAGTPTPGKVAAYVAIDQFEGRVDGLPGGFLLLHRGTRTRSESNDLSITVAPDSGTGALEGIAGTLTIEEKSGKHFYDLEYTLFEPPLAL